MFRKKNIENGKVKIYYEFNRKKPVLVFLHGAGCNMTVFSDYRERFDRLGFGCLSIDLRGCGKSSLLLKESAYTLEEHVKDLEIILKEEGIVSISIIAHSMGAMVAQAFTAKHPDMVKSLILISGSYNFTKSFERSFFRKVFLEFIRPLYLKIFDIYIILEHLISRKRKNHLPDFNNGKWVKIKDLSFDFHLRPILGIKRTKVLNVYSNALLKWDTEKQAKKIEAPTLLVCGDKDCAVPLRTGQELHKMIVNSLEPIVIKQGEHGMVFRKDWVIIKEVEKFLSNISRN